MSGDLQNLTGLQSENSTHVVTRRFITVPTTACHLSLSWARLIQSTHSNHIPLKSVLILSSLLLRGVSVGIRPSDFPDKTQYVFPSDSDLTHSHPSRPLIFGHPLNIIRETQNGDGHYYVFNFLQAPVTPLPPLVQISSSVASCGTPSVYILPSMQETELHTHVT
jgi:hypothetical protein